VARGALQTSYVAEALFVETWRVALVLEVDLLDVGAPSTRRRCMRATVSMLRGG
jgi:hypothetical protein